MRIWGMLVRGMCLVVGLWVEPAFPAPVPDTGMTQCYDDAGNVTTRMSPGHRFYGQDGNYLIYPPSYPETGASGNALPNLAPHGFMGERGLVAMGGGFGFTRCIGTKKGDGTCAQSA